MKKIISACAVLALVAMLAAVPCVSAAEDAPKLIAHYEFKNGSVGKDSAGSGDMKVVKPDAQSAADAKVVEGPKGMSALEFDASYALITDKKDVLDPLKEYTVTFLLSPNEAGNLLYTAFSTGQTNWNAPINKGSIILFNKEAGNPEVRVYGGDPTAADGTKFAEDQFKNDDGAKGLEKFAERGTKTAPYKYEAGVWYRVVLTIQVADGRTAGKQELYIDKMDAVTSKASLVRSKNYYSDSLPAGLTDLNNPQRPISLGACYNWESGKDQNQFTVDENTNLTGRRNFSMFMGKMADVRFYDKALTQDQIVELFKNNKIAGEEGSSEPPVTTTAANNDATTAANNDATTAAGNDTTTAADVATTTAAKTTAAANTSNPADDGENSNTGLIIGIVIAAIVVLAGAGAAVYFLVIKKKNGDVPPAGPDDDASSSGTDGENK